MFPKIIGHRGICIASSSCIENTTQAVKEALKRGAWGVEIDVQKTADNEIVAFHDYDMHRLTGQSGCIRDYTFAQLSDRFQINSLNEIMCVAKSLNMFVNIEIKCNTPKTPEMVLYNVTKFWGSYLNSILFSSFDHDCLSYLSYMSKISNGTIKYAPIDFVDQLSLSTQVNRLSSAFVYHIDKPFLVSNVPVIIYGVRNRDQYNILMSKGVTSVITDDPGIVSHQ